MTEIASHRGGALLWAENSRLAFEQTAKLPVEQVEFDVHPSRDGRLVVIHDATLERTTDGTGAVCQHDWADLSKLILKGSGGQRMLLLDEVIEIFRPTKIILRLEMKAGPGRVPYPDHPARIMAALKAARHSRPYGDDQLPARHRGRGHAPRQADAPCLAGDSRDPDRYRPRGGDRPRAQQRRAHARPARQCARRVDGRKRPRRPASASAAGLATMRPRSPRCSIWASTSSPPIDPIWRST